MPNLREIIKEFTVVYISRNLGTLTNLKDLIEAPKDQLKGIKYKKLSKKKIK